MSKNGMTRYVIKRILYMFLVLFIIMTMCFILIKLLPLPAVREMGRDINLVLAKRWATTSRSWCSTSCT